MTKIKNNCANDVLMGNINDAIWATSRFDKFTFSVLLDKDKIIHMIGVGDVSEVFVSIVLVSEGLVALVKRLPMSHV